MKRIAYYALHYGKEYLAWSIRSIQEAVDDIVVFYTPTPSFGHSTTLICPDSEEKLRSEACRFLKRPLVWIRGHWTSEGQHRGEILRFARERGIDQVLAVDSDEIWHPSVLNEAFDVSAKRPEKNVLVRFIHFWRSFGWVCKDPCMPVRIINVGRKDGIWYLSPQAHPVFHFGYAQIKETVKYKESIHGHKSEWRNGWFEEKFLKWNPENGVLDVHPTNLNFWNPERVSRETQAVLKDLLGDHPYFGLEMIDC